MNYGVMYDPALAGEVRIPVENMPKMALDARKIIARRAAFELPPNGVINLGVGAPDGVAAVANEEKVTPYITMTTEAGAVGGVLAGGSSFGSSANAHSVIDQNQMFDFYDGGGLDMTCLGMAECDERRQRQHEHVRRPTQWLRRLHQHYPKRPRRRLRRHIHRRWSRSRRRERQVEDRPRRPVAQVRQESRAGDV